MSSCGKELLVQAGDAVAPETLHMLSVVLKTAFRTHCTGETVAGKGPWQLVQEVQARLAALSRGTGTLVSEERLVRYLETELADPSPAATPALTLVGVIEDSGRDKLSA